MLLQKQHAKPNNNSVPDDTTFKLLQDIHDGIEPQEKLEINRINSKSATIYLARELNFLQAVASASGHELTSQLLYNLHVELLRTSMAASTKTAVQ